MPPSTFGIAHRLCLLSLVILGPFTAVYALDDATHEIIVKEHNVYRQKVSPTAKNMMAMHWDADAAETADYHANKLCDLNTLKHDTADERTPSSWKDKKKTCGQNLYTGSGLGSPDWVRVIKLWHDEVNDFQYGSGSTNGKPVGHYTQVVWADSYTVGCGVGDCGDGKFYAACNYCPGGNIYTTDPNAEMSLSKPYVTGASATDCTHGKYTGGYDGKLCQNPDGVVGKAGTITGSGAVVTLSTAFTVTLLWRMLD